MKNTILKKKTANDIDHRVARVLRGLGNPEPPLRLRDVRELLKLDLAYYTGDDDGLFRDSISKLTIAGKQVLKRPSILWDAIRKFDLRSLYLLDQKRIMLDRNVPNLKQRWNESHEIGHSLIPWHEDSMLGDTAFTLSRHCHVQMEADANFAAGQLLFLRDRFSTEANDHEPSLDVIRKLNRRFGNTISSTLWRFIEMSHSDLQMVGMISVHPHESRHPANFNPSNPCRHFIQSPAFARQFSRISERAVFDLITRYCGNQGGGPLGEAELMLTDDNGEDHVFFFETFFNRYDALTLGVYVRPHTFPITV